MRPRLPGRFLPHALLAALFVLSLAWSIPTACLIPLPDGSDDFNSAGFVVRHSWVKFAMLASRPLTGTPSRAEEDAMVARFFELNRLIDAEARTGGDPASAPDAAAQARTRERKLRDERNGIKNRVQLILEGRLTRVAKRAGLTRNAGTSLVWPPVNIEFQDPPAVLVTSPRAEIRKESETLLQGDLPVERVQRIEADAERDGATSALVVDISGIAMYPAIIPYDADYHYILQDIAHEWTHHYLYFTPLGRRYFDSSKLTTLNETVANMVGRELGDMMFAAYPLAGAAPASVAGAAPAPAAAAAPTGIDFVAEMRDLRRQVEVLLADGKVDDAERLMEERRAFLAANGYYIRKLNQAYFAFHGSYADSAGSIDPIGPKLDALRKQSPSLKSFVERARELTSEGDLDRELLTP